MPAKRVKEEAKSATDIEISVAYEAMMKGEAAVQNCKEAINDMVLHTSRLKQLEAELGPREAEHKAIIEKFYRIAEGGCVFRKQRGPGAHIAAASMGTIMHHQAKPTTPRSRSTVPMAPPEPASDDKELNKLMANACKSVVMGTLQPLFFLPRTQNEARNAAVLAARIAEVTALPQTADQSASGGATGKVTPRKKVPAGAASASTGVPMSQQPLKPEPALLPPIGVDFMLHGEVLRLREQRLSAEKSMEDLQAQIRQSRDTLQRRREEGSGTKAALKKAEKELNVLIKAHSALTFKKEGEEIVKRKEEAAAAMKKSEEKTGKKK